MRLKISPLPRVGPVWAALVGLFLFVADIVTAAHATTDAGDVFSNAFGLVMFLGALWLGFSEKPLLVVDARGIRAPLCFVNETIGWARVAVVREAPHWGHSALEIMAWDDARDTTVPAKPVVWIRIGAASVHLDRGDLDAAAADIAPVLDMAPDLRVATVTACATWVDRRLRSRRFQGSPAADQLRSDLRDFAASALPDGSRGEHQ